MSRENQRKSLTSRQEKVFRFIKKHKALQGYSPTVREIGEEFDISPNGSYDHLKALARKGFIRMDPHKSRSIKVIRDLQTDPAPEEFETMPNVDWVKIPVLGRVAAGPLTYADQDVEEYLTLPMEEYRDGEYFALRVKGESMIECGIYEGDIVIIRKQCFARDNDIVVAIVEDDATLKRFRRIEHKIFLIPENHTMQPIIVDEQEVSILGKLTAVYRKY